METVNALVGRGVAFASLHEGIDTTTSTGRLIFHIFAALAEFERELIAERAAVGRQAARARGRLADRPNRARRRSRGAGPGLRSWRRLRARGAGWPGAGNSGAGAWPG